MPMFRSITYVFALFSKEVSELIRQPRLILSLILGPFLVLLLFGMSFKGGLPHFRIALVVPQNSVSPSQLDELKKVILQDFTIVSEDSDQAAAEAKLRNGQVEIVEVLPANFAENAKQGKQSLVQIEYNQIDPTNESWVQYLGSSQVEAMNRTILREAVRQTQQQSGAFANVPPEVVVSPLVPQFSHCCCSILR
jgi:ABC-2 type transport system permease protein